jgi:hypothetical protein
MDSQKETRWVISYGQLGLLLLTFALGVITALLFSNSQTGTPTTFTTTELVGFVLSVLLSGASIVLAVTAIALGKSSEQSVIKRSDESIRLQNDVFIKTTEALQRIEASTGVTEKRIEDIISGRVGDISHQIAEMATSGGKRRPDAKELEEDIRRSLMKTITSASRDEERTRRKQRVDEEEIKEERYQKAHLKLLLEIGNRENVKIEKIGHGSIGNEGEDLFDGIYSFGGRKIAISTFREDSKAEGIQEFISSGAHEISKGLIQKFVVVLFADNEGDKRTEMVGEQIALLKDDLSKSIQVVSLNYESALEAAKAIEL